MIKNNDVVVRVKKDIHTKLKERAKNEESTVKAVACNAIEFYMKKIPIKNK